MKLLLLSFFFIFSTFLQGQVVADIKFTGIRRMNVTFLEKLIKTKKEQVLDSLLLQNDVQILNRLNGISNAVFTVATVENSNLVNITFLITENYSLIPALNIATTQTNGAYRFGLYEYNFLGKNNTIGGFYQYNDYNSGGISFSSPQLFSAKLGASLSLQKLTSLEPIFFNQSNARYIYTNSAADITLNYNFNAKNEIKFGAVVFKEKYQYANGAKDPAIPLQLILNKKLLKTQYIYDNLQYDYYLVEGFKSNLIVQGVVTENNFNKVFLIAWNDFLYFKNFGNKLNFASRIRLGFSDNSKSPFSPFAVDNNLNIRGVGNIIDRGTGIFVLNTEARQTIFEKKWFVLQGNAFVDSGSWRNPGGKISDFADAKNFRIYSGLGLRFIHKTIFNAVFRLDYGYGFTKNASQGFVFGIGQYF